MIKKMDQIDIHFNNFDNSKTEYLTDDKKGRFEIFFDEKLFIAP